MGVKLLNSIEAAWNWPDDPGANLVSEVQWQEIACAANLSGREFEVCQLLFEGLTREEVAEELSLKTRTVRQYMEHLHAKLRVTNRVGLVLRIIQIRDYIEHEPPFE